MHGSLFTKPLNILKTSMRSPLTVLVSSVCKCRSHTLLTPECTVYVEETTRQYIFEARRKKLESKINAKLQEMKLMYMMFTCITFHLNFMEEES